MASPVRSDRFTGTTQDIIYSDFLTDLTPHPITGDPVRALNDQAITRSLRALMSTDRGERLYQPNYGSDIRSLLFENVNGVNAESLSVRIQQAVEAYEPRVKLLSIVVTPDYDSNYYVVTITYMLINREDPITTSINLYRVR